MSRGHELLQAVQEGDLPTAQTLLEQKINPNCSDQEGNTPLHWAAYQGFHHFIPVLLSHGAKATQKNTKQETPIHMASIWKRWQCLREFIRLSPVERDNQAAYQGALYEAMRASQIDVIDDLLTAGVSLNAAWDYLHLAMLKKDMGLIKKLIDSGIDLTIKISKGLTAQAFAKTFHDRALESFLNLIIAKSKLLFLAAKKNDLPIVEALLADGVSPWVRFDKSCALLQSKDPRIIRLLAAQGPECAFKTKMLQELYCQSFKANFEVALICLEFLPKPSSTITSWLLGSVLRAKNPQFLFKFLVFCEEKNLTYEAKTHDLFAKDRQFKMLSVDAASIMHTSFNELITLLIRSVKKSPQPDFEKNCLLIGMQLFAIANELEEQYFTAMSLAIAYLTHAFRYHDSQKLLIHAYVKLAGLEKGMALKERMALKLDELVALLKANPEARKKLLHHYHYHLIKILAPLHPHSQHAKAESEFVALLTAPPPFPKIQQSYFSFWSANRSLNSGPAKKEKKLSQKTRQPGILVP